MNDYLAIAIKRLKPTAEFSYDNRDYATIKWDVLEGKAPTQDEIDDAVEQIKADEIAAAKTKATAKAAAQAKLSALGLTVEDLQALGL
jgi:hypothetical protein